MGHLFATVAADFLGTGVICEGMQNINFWGLKKGENITFQLANKKRDAMAISLKEI